MKAKISITFVSHGDKDQPLSPRAIENLAPSYSYLTSFYGVLKKDFTIHVVVEGDNPPDVANETVFYEDRADASDATTFLWAIATLVRVNNKCYCPIELCVNGRNHSDSLDWFIEKTGPYGEIMGNDD